MIKNLTGKDIEEYEKTAGIGYRFSRNGGVRLEKANEFADKVLFHNYGHGGAGYTLSWGCAFQILKLIIDETGQIPFDKIDVKRAVPKKNSTSALISILKIMINDIYHNGIK